MADAGDLQELLYEAHQILERAVLITGDAPFFMYCSQAEFAKVVIDDDEATLFWPESVSGYYNDHSIETQSVKFPSKLLLMSIEEIKAWKIEQRKG